MARGFIKMQKSRRVANESVLIREMAEAMDPGIKSKTLAIVEGPSALLLMAVFSLYALFGLDLWEAIGPPPISLDPVAYSISTIVFVIFCVELVLLAWCRKDYFCSFFFWLDLFASVSMIPDVCMLFGIDIFILLGGGQGGLIVARTARAVRAGSRIARFARTMRLLSRTNANKNTSIIGGRLASGVTQKIIIVIGFVLFATDMLNMLNIEGSVEFNIIAGTLLKLHALCRNASIAAPARGCHATNAQVGCDKLSTAPEYGAACH